MINYMTLALEKAQESVMEVPVGAVIIKDNQVVAAFSNMTIEKLDVTAHAEILALREASKILNTVILKECDLYVSLEPCAMCAQAISYSRIRRLYFGAYNKKGGAIENGPKIFQFCAHVPEIYGGIMEDKSAKILKDFFNQLRSDKKPTTK